MRADLQTASQPGLFGPRSGNLRLKEEFSDQDRDAFVRNTFDLVCNYFEKSIHDIGKQHSNVQGSFERIDSRRMHAVLCRHGKTLTECSVRLGGLFNSNGIVISLGRQHSDTSFNEMLSVEASPHALHMRSMGMATRFGRADLLTQDEYAELLWSMFVERAQR
ncbi:hypothetical protein GCM10007320_29710 [Pseudorhodoferax aquiterrae]|uniref:Uncharacterized protein n=2 Tax=Pseudorhodoferax aquiterrae TaxID=747304 RepID=A0ABQ3G352_9BURK|nr:hypothetical protein GCM10007320_29710 [Pseudorhodoferax aquiterrae]